jgi:peptidoglycan/LPS O-acetylase OafA/YrhL
MPWWRTRLDGGILDRPGVTSLLDHLRWMAALLVLVGHVRNWLFQPYAAVPDLGVAGRLFYAITNLQSEAVICFFVLSGALIGGKLVEHGKAQHFPLAHYAIDRLTRIYVVLLPALALSAAVSLAGLCPSEPRQFVGTLLFVQHVLTDIPVCNKPVWSLANEGWYYALSVIAILAVRRKPLAWIAAALSLALLLMDPVDPYNVLLYLPIWASGLLLLRPASTRPPPWVAFVAFLAALAVSRSHVLDDWFWLRDALIAATLVAFLVAFAASPHARRPVPCPRLGKRLAAFSFSLYLIHWPLLHLTVEILGRYRVPRLLDPRAPLSYAYYAAICAIFVAVAYLFAQLTEARTGRVRRALYSLMAGGAATPAKRA